jgi:hypothetical protein
MTCARADRSLVLTLASVVFVSYRWCRVVSSVFLFLCDRSGSRLLETLVSLGGVQLVSPFFRCHLEGRLLELAKHQIANFALQVRTQQHTTTTTNRRMRRRRA